LRKYVQHWLLVEPNRIVKTVRHSYILTQIISLIH